MIEDGDLVRRQRRWGEVDFQKLGRDQEILSKHLEKSANIKTDLWDSSQRRALR
jgi:hypothetical protein